MNIAPFGSVKKRSCKLRPILKAGKGLRTLSIHVNKPTVLVAFQPGSTSSAYDERDKLELC